jgi:hypothetical protein
MKKFTLRNGLSLLLLPSLLCISCSALAVDATDPPLKKEQKAYDGGGVRGAAPDVADGWLVSPDEAQRFQGPQAFDEEPALRPRALVPVIDILKPELDADQKVRAPFAIAVQFHGQPDAAIVPGSFRVLYGALKIDITSRITQYVTVTEQGFTLENAKIPVGKHRLTLQVQDARQRVGERELRFEVQ